MPSTARNYKASLVNEAFSMETSALDETDFVEDLLK